MKKKFFIVAVLLICLFGFTACGKRNINLADYLIEEREVLYTASDKLYNVSLSCGKRETNYEFDGIVNEKVDFAIISFAKNDNSSLTNDTYTFCIKIGEDSKTGFLTKNETNNAYSTDLEIFIPADAQVEIQVSFTGYLFSETLENTSNKFNVDKNTALNMANQQLAEDVINVLSNRNVKIEVVMKLLKDYSSTELKNYYWYVGVISTNGETLGILIDANTGNIIAKKV